MASEQTPTTQAEASKTPLPNEPTASQQTTDGTKGVPTTATATGGGSQTGKVGADKKPRPQSQGAGSSLGSRLSRVISSNKGAGEGQGQGQSQGQGGSLGKQFFSAYAKTWIGMSPIWLMGEALIPNRKVGTTLRGGGKELIKTGEAIRRELAFSADDVIVIVDKKLRSSSQETTTKTAEVLKAAGEHAIVLVTSNIDKASDQLHRVSPKLKKTMQKEGRDAIVLLDKSLKNPIVITGVQRFAVSKGIPYSAALLKLASLALNKILEAIPEAIEEVEGEIADVIEGVEGHKTGTSKDKTAKGAGSTKANTAPSSAKGKDKGQTQGKKDNITRNEEDKDDGIVIDELDAAELERMASPEAEKEANEIEKEAELGATEDAKMPGGLKSGDSGKDQTKNQGKGRSNSCVVC